jgi:uncharacterized protein YkwD
MRMRTVALGLVIGLGLTTCGGGGGGGDGDCTTPSSGTTMSGAESSLGAQVLVLVNQERGDRSLSTLNWHGGLAQVAFEHSWDMDMRGFFDHTNPCGEEPWDRVSQAGISWTVIAENIARGQTTAMEAMTVWMNSSGHRANILDSRMTHCAIGVYQGPTQTYWTMVLIQQ